MEKFKVITRWLLNTKDAIASDKTAFELWKRGRLTTSEMKEQFLKNNHFPELAASVISDELLEEWLGTIGWRRPKIKL